MNYGIPESANDVFHPDVSGKIHKSKETNIFDNKGDYIEKDDLLTKKRKEEPKETGSIMMKTTTVMRECTCRQHYTAHWSLPTPPSRPDPDCKICKGHGKYSYISVDPIESPSYLHPAKNAASGQTYATANSGYTYEEAYGIHQQFLSRLHKNSPWNTNNDQKKYFEYLKNLYDSGDATLDEIFVKIETIPPGEYRDMGYAWYNYVKSKKDDHLNHIKGKKMFYGKR